MEKEKKNGVVTIVMGVIIVILVVLCVLFASGIIEFNKVEKNNVETNNNVDKENMKLEKEKDWVYNADYNLPTDKDSYYGYNDHSILVSASDLIVPYININSEDAEKVNQDIYKLYEELIESFNNNLKEEIWFSLIKYDKFYYNNVVSVVITIENAGTGASSYDYYTYNFDIKNGNLLTYEELLNELDYNKEETLYKMQEQTKLKIEELYGASGDDFTTVCNGSCYEKANNLISQSIYDNSILAFSDNEGKLNVMVIPFYSGVQNGEKNHYLITIEK